MERRVDLHPFAGASKAAGFDVARLRSPAEAVAAFFARVTLAPPGVERVAIGAAAGRILANDAAAREDHPAHPRSTMDGFAVRASDGVAPRRIVAAVAMGAAAPAALGANDAMRIPTGGALPDGADAVVPQEDARIDGATVVPQNPPVAGAFVTARAEDVAAGEIVVRAGRRLGAPEVGVLAALGFAEVPVFRKPRIAVLSTGDELVDVGATAGPGQVRDSNRYALGAALAALGAEVVHVARAADTAGSVRAALAAALAGNDALVTTGGSSVGAGDLVPDIVAELGAPGPIVHGLRVKPGKPTLLAAVGHTPVIGLPGNPTSALMIFEAVARPIFEALTGERPGARTPLWATALEPIAGCPGWTWFVPVRVTRRDGTFYAAPLPLRSAWTSLLARANGYVVLGDESAPVEPGDVVPIERFSGGGAPIEEV